MAYNSLLPPELQAVYQQQFSGGVPMGGIPMGADGYVSQQSDPSMPSQMTYYHEGQLPDGYTISQTGQVGQSYPSPAQYSGQQGYLPTSQAAITDGTVSTYPTPIPPAQGFSSQPVMGHYNPQPFTAHPRQSMSGGIPPPFKPMPVLPPIQSGPTPGIRPMRMESSPAVMQNSGSFGHYTLEGTLEYGTLVDAGDFAGSFEMIPDNLKQELQENYGMYPRTDIKIIMENGSYHLYATPVIEGQRRQLPPITGPRFQHSPMSLHAMRRSVRGYPRPIAQRPITRYSDDFETVNLSRASNYHNQYSPSPRRLAIGGNRGSVIYERDGFDDYDMDSVIVEDLKYPSPKPRVYADYVRSSKLSEGSRSRYRSPTRYTARSKNRAYSDYGSDSRLENAIRHVFRS